MSSRDSRSHQSGLARSLPQVVKSQGDRHLEIRRRLIEIELTDGACRFVDGRLPVADQGGSIGLLEGQVDQLVRRMLRPEGQAFGIEAVRLRWGP